MSLTSFSLGYYGFGNRPEKLVQLVDEHEVNQGYQAPFFVDIRLSRSVRAPGFNGNTFRNIVGRDRYVHMPDLGNIKIASGQSGIKIKDPDAAGELLDVIDDRHRRNQRVIFFCWCPRPIGCHRRVVSRLLKARANRGGIDLQLVEWPGGDPEHHDVEVSEMIIRMVDQGRSFLPLPAKRKDLRTLPCWSVVRLKCGSEVRPIHTGRAFYKKGVWAIPYLDDADGTRVLGLRDARRIQGVKGYKPL